MKTDVFEKQLESILKEYYELGGHPLLGSRAVRAPAKAQSLVSRVVAVVNRLTGSGSSYSTDIKRILANSKHLRLCVAPIIGVGAALLADLKAGYTETLVEQLHAETFADFMGMAQHLADTGFKDAAAVIAGSALEAHLRAACAKASIDTEICSGGSLRPKRSDRLNADLAKAGVYSKLDQKSVTAWLALRNNAAHGEYAEYDHAQVKVMIDGIRGFMARNPA